MSSRNELGELYELAQAYNRTLKDGKPHQQLAARQVLMDHIGKLPKKS